MNQFLDYILFLDRDIEGDSEVDSLLRMDTLFDDECFKDGVRNQNIFRSSSSLRSSTSGLALVGQGSGGMSGPSGGSSSRPIFIITAVCRISSISSSW